MPAMWIGAGASILGGLMSSKGSDKAAKAQQQAAQQGIEEQRRQYDTTRTDLAPWRKSGKRAVNKLDLLLGLQAESAYNPAVKSARAALQNAQNEYNALLQFGPTSGSTQSSGWDPNKSGQEWYDGGVATTTNGGVDSGALNAAKQRVDQARNALTRAQGQDYDAGPDYGSLIRPFGMDDFEVDPGYAFRQAEGMKGIENSAAARGMQLSGANLKGLQRFNQNLASDEYSRAFGRDASNKDRTYNFLSGVSGSGQNAATMTGNFGAQSAGSISDLLTQQGNAASAGIIGGANAFGGAANDIGNYFQMQSLLRKQPTNQFQVTNGAGWE